MRKHRDHSSNERSYNRTSLAPGRHPQQPRDSRAGEFTERGGGFSGGQSYGQTRENDSQRASASSPGGGSPRGDGRTSNGYGEMNWEGDEFESRNAGFRGGSGSDWSSEGRYAGLGPKGYTRSDERIKEEISDALTAHGGIDASDCTVQVSDGEVMLEGEVENREMKRAIEDVAEACSGVKQVHNRLRVASNGNGHESSRSSRFSGPQSSSQGEGMEGSSSSSSKKGPSPSARS